MQELLGQFRKPLAQRLHELLFPSLSEASAWKWLVGLCSSSLELSGTPRFCLEDPQMTFPLLVPPMLVVHGYFSGVRTVRCDSGSQQVVNTVELISSDRAAQSARAWWHEIRSICQTMPRLLSKVLFGFDTRVSTHPRALATVGVKKPQWCCLGTGKPELMDKPTAVGQAELSPFSENDEQLRM